VLFRSGTADIVVDSLKQLVVEPVAEGLRLAGGPGW
jgi:hypothetical protein